jgi:DNA-3-methyladenine glycosylase
MSPGGTGKRRDPPIDGAFPVQEMEPGGSCLPYEFYLRPAEVVARDLLGAVIESTVGGVTARAVIVETEAYTGPDDDASHAAARIGRTRRNDVMFGRAGLAYVYRIYGIHWCLNAVSDVEGHPAAVLIRAARPIGGWSVVRDRRGGRPDRDLLRGPGNLCAGLGITGDLNGHALDRPPLILREGVGVPEVAVARGPRIGITRAADLSLRFWIRESPWVSGRA